MRLVITFHDIGDSGCVLSFPIRSFRRLVDALVRHDVPILRFDELLSATHGVSFTFDDGMASVYEEALPVLRTTGVGGHIFLATDPIGNGSGWEYGPARGPKHRMLDWWQVEECAANGLSIEAHTASHPDLRKLTTPEIVENCLAGDAAIERHIGRRPALFAYPYGRMDRRVCTAVAPLYRACFTTRLRPLANRCELSRVPRVDAYYLKPTWLHSNPTSLAALAYLEMRGVLRTIKGST